MSREEPEPLERASAGLCADCSHGRRVVSTRGSRFWLCGLADRDPAFARYPRLPVLTCPGHEGKLTMP